MRKKIKTGPCVRIAFVWDGPSQSIQVPDRLSFESFSTIEFKTFADLVARIMETSLNRRDRKATRDLGAMQATINFLEEAGKSFDTSGSWSMAYLLGYRHSNTPMIAAFKAVGYYKQYGSAKNVPL